MKHRHGVTAAALSAAIAALAVTAPMPRQMTASAVSSGTSLSDMPSSYVAGADWIWENRIMNEDSMGIKSKRWNLLFDQIIANKGKLNYVVRWQSYKNVTLEQRQQFAELVDNGINAWCDWLVGYENWPYQHVEVNIVGWAVLDASNILDPQPGEVIWDNIKEPYDASYDTSNGRETIPDVLCSAPAELWTFNYFTDRNHVYNGQSFDEYLWCTQGWPDVGGAGGDWGQRLSDNAYLSMIGSGGFPHVYWHELGHGFGMTDFYGGEGASDGFPPGGFPGGENSLMMAGSASKITDFDGWMLRYMWSKISTDTKRFDLANAVDPNQTTKPAETTVTVSDVTTAPPTVTTTVPVGDSQSSAGVYDSQNQYWLIDTNGASKIALEAIGVPWAALSGQYGYWDDLSQQWVQAEYIYDESLGESGRATVEIELPAGQRTDQLQIQVFYYAQWSNDANDMVDQDRTALQFIAHFDGAAVTETTVTTVQTVPEATTTTQTSEPEVTETTTTTAVSKPATSMWGDVDISNSVDISDAVLLLRYLAEDRTATVTEQGKINADVTHDGITTNDDAIKILHYLANFISQEALATA